MRISTKVILGIWIVIFSLIINGCSLFPTNKTRPAPIRPSSIRKLPTPSTVPSPTRGTLPPSKRITGISSITERELLLKISKIDQAAKDGNWALANRETNSFGVSMAKFHPAAAKGRSLRDMTNFNALYAKLQADVKIKNKTAVAGDTKRLAGALQGLK